MQTKLDSFLTPLHKDLKKIIYYSFILNNLFKTQFTLLQETTDLLFPVDPNADQKPSISRTHLETKSR